MRTEKQSEETSVGETATTRDKILDAMYALVAEKGYDKASISQICAAVGITKPSLYYYFPSKEDLFLAMSERLWPTLDPFDEEASAITDPALFRPYIDNVGQSIIARYRNDEQRRHVLAEIDLQATRIPRIVSQQERLGGAMTESLTAMLRHGVDIGALPAAFDAERNAAFLYVVLSGINQVIARHEHIDAPDIWERAVDCVFNDCPSVHAAAKPGDTAENDPAPTKRGA